MGSYATSTLSLFEYFFDRGASVVTVALSHAPSGISCTYVKSATVLRKQMVTGGVLEQHFIDFEIALMTMRT